MTDEEWLACRQKIMDLSRDVLKVPWGNTEIDRCDLLKGINLIKSEAVEKKKSSIFAEW